MKKKKIFFFFKKKELLIKMVYKNLNNHLIFIVILFVKIVVHGQQGYVPEPRVGHAAARVRDRIYYVGGFRDASVTPQVG
jgi:hypothetical protein